MSQNDMNKEESCRHKSHNHEILGSTKVAGCCEYAHSHRFATVSGDAIPCDGSHVHEIKFTTDSCDGHFHEFRGTSGPAIDVGCGHHVHFAEACTTTADNHKHKFQVASLIQNPTCE